MRRQISNPDRRGNGAFAHVVVLLAILLLLAVPASAQLSRGLRAPTDDTEIGGEGETVHPQPVVCPEEVILYVGAWNPPRVDRYCISNILGTPIYVGSTAAIGDVRALRAHPSGDYLYYADSNLLVYRVAALGLLVPQDLVVILGGAFDEIAFDPSADTLYGSHSSGNLYVFDISDQSATPNVVQALPGHFTPHGVCVSSDDSVVLLANQWSFIGDPDTDQEIVGYALDANGLAIPEPSTATDYLARPDYMIIHPDLPYVYYTDRPGGNLSVIQVGGGAFTRLQEVFSGFGATRLVMNEAATRIFVANADDFSVSVFEVAPNGMVTKIQEVGTGLRPRDVVLHPDGTYLYVINEGWYPIQPASITTYAIVGPGTLFPVGPVVALPGAYRGAAVRLVP